jgi:hypothetical protein
VMAVETHRRLGRGLPPEGIGGKELQRVFVVTALRFANVRETKGGDDLSGRTFWSCTFNDETWLRVQSVRLGLAGGSGDAALLYKIVLMHLPGRGRNTRQTSRDGLAGGLMRKGRQLVGWIC